MGIRIKGVEETMIKKIYCLGCNELLPNTKHNIRVRKCEGCELE